jgi:lysophospholipase L1-like esterase
MTQVFGPGKRIDLTGIVGQSPGVGLLGTGGALPYLQTLGPVGRYFDPNSLRNLADGAAIASWPDSSANKVAATQATGANQPTFKNLSGQPLVEFTAASSQYLDMGTDATAPTDYTIFVVFRPKTLSGTKSLLSNRHLAAPGSGTVMQLGYNSSGNPLVGQNSATPGSFQYSVNLLINTTYILCFRQSSTAGRDFFFSGTTSKTDTTTALTATKALAGYIGRDGTNYLDGYVGDIVIYTAALTDQKVGRALDFLKRKQALNVLHSDRYLTSPLANPLTSPRTATPGPGSVTIVDTNNKLTVSGGKLQFANGTYGNEYISPVATQLRWAGKAVISSFTVQNANESHHVGWGYNNLSWSNGVGTGVLFFDSGNIKYVVGNNISTAIIVGTYSPLLTYTVALVARSAGGSLAFIKGGAYTSWTLLWVDNVDTVAPLQPVFSTGSQSGALDEFDVVDLPEPYNSDFGPATNYFATSTDGQVTAAPSGNALVVHTITAATGVDQELEVRRAADTSSVVIKMLQVAGTIGVYTRTSGGVDTLVGTTAALTWTNGSIYRVEVILDGTAIKTAVEGVLKNSVASSQNQTETGVKASKAGTLLSTWARSGYGFPWASKRAQSRLVLSQGDSKTVGSGDDQPPHPNFGGFQPILVDSLTTSTGQQWLELQRLAVGGTNTSYWAGRIDSDLALITDTPGFILVNMGTNIGISVAQDEADYGYVLDAYHAKWPNARIYLARFWRNGMSAAETAWDDVSIPRIISTRSSFCFLGMDERTFLPGPSGTGAEYTIDGIHPNRAGYTLTAAAWKTAMGY